MLFRSGPVAPQPAAAAPARAETPLLEVDVALQRLGGRQALYERLVQSFARDVPKEMDAFGRHLAQGSRADALRVLHTLRGLAGAVGASALAEFAGRQELALRDGVGAGAFDLAALQTLLDDSLAALAEAVAPAPPAAASPVESAGVDPLETLRRLRLLLVDRNMRSVAACEQLCAAHADALGPELAQLSTAVARLDFTRALRVCDLLLARLNPR